MDKPWKVVFAFVGVFIAGAVFGGFFSLRIDRRFERMQNPFSHGGGPAVAGSPQIPAAPPGPQHTILQVPPLWQAARLMRVYEGRLDLTPEQKETINPVIQRAAEDFHRLQQTNFRENGVITHRLQEDIAKVLTPEQKVRLEKMEQHQRELLSRGERTGGPGMRAFREAQHGGEKGAPANDKGASGTGEPKAPPTTAPATQTPPPAPDGEKK